MNRCFAYSTIDEFEITCDGNQILGLQALLLHKTASQTLVSNVIYPSPINFPPSVSLSDCPAFTPSHSLPPTQEPTHSSTHVTKFKGISKFLVNQIFMLSNLSLHPKLFPSRKCNRLLLLKSSSMMGNIISYTMNAMLHT
jgi:hypothetical protein